MLKGPSLELAINSIHANPSLSLRGKKDVEIAKAISYENKDHLHGRTDCHLNCSGMRHAL